MNPNDLAEGNPLPRRTHRDERARALLESMRERPSLRELVRELTARFEARQISTIAERNCRV